MSIDEDKKRRQAADLNKIKRNAKEESQENNPPIPCGRCGKTHKKGAPCKR